MDLTLQQLRTLREVAARGTIAAAADALGYTPSAVSQQLSGLRKAVGVEVLERIGRNVQLTDAGRELVRHAGEVLERVEVAQVAIERVTNEVRGQLTINVYESVASTLLVPLLQALRVRHPDLVLRSKELIPDLAADSVAAGHSDLAFGIDYRHSPAAPRSDVVRETVAEDAFRLCVADGDPLADRHPAVVDLGELNGRDFIAESPEGHCGRCVLLACRRHGFEPTLVHELDDYPTALQLVAAGEGITLVPDLALVAIPPGVRVLDLAQPVGRTIQLLYRTASADRPAIQAVRSVLADVVADYLPVGPAAAPVPAVTGSTWG